MKAFLSHSSKDKTFVEDTASLLTPGTYEIDSVTFDAGDFNASVITEALNRCDIFCLFLSANSLDSAYVKFETDLSYELFARGRIKKCLILCIDQDIFPHISDRLRAFSIARYINSPESAARAIEGVLISSTALGRELSHPFVGRENALKELESRVFDLSSRGKKAIYISGNAGVGRRSLVRKFFQNQYPEVEPIFPTISIGSIDGLDEIYRKIITATKKIVLHSDFIELIRTFSEKDREQKILSICASLDEVVKSRGSSFIMIEGNGIGDGSVFPNEILPIVSRLDATRHPAISIISTRMAPSEIVREAKDIAFYGVQSFSREESIRLAQRLLMRSGVSASETQIAEIIELCDYHPYNFYYLIDEIKKFGVGAVISNPASFNEWKHKRYSAYLSRIEFTKFDIMVVGILNILPSLDFEAIVNSLDVGRESVGAALMKLVELHVVEHDGDNYSISPALRSSISRDDRVKFSRQKRKEIMLNLAKSLSVRIDEGNAPISLIDSAVLSSIESSTTTNISIYLLPSHYVILAKEQYDQKNYLECIRLARDALKADSRLISIAAFVTACRYLCLAATRKGDDENFNYGISKLSNAGDAKWIKSNIYFLQGFNKRIQGNVPEAEALFRKAYRISPQKYSAARELAAICLARNNLPEAETFAREAYSVTSTNIYVLDILIAVLTRKLKRRAKDNHEIKSLMVALSEEGDGSGYSFYTTRCAEIEYWCGDASRARRLAESALVRTPNVFEARRIYVLSCIKSRDMNRALEGLNAMSQQVLSRDNEERKSNYRVYLDTRAEYFVEAGKFDDAKLLYADRTVFSEQEAIDAIKNVEQSQARAELRRD